MDLETVSKLYQDVLQGIEADLETGSHHFNNAAHREFSLRYKYMVKALDALGRYIIEQENA